MQYIYAAAAMVFYIFSLGLLNFYTRFTGVKSGAFKLGYFKNLDATAYNVPEFVVRMGRHYNNQFELPLLYLITCVVAAMLHVESTVGVVAAWGFIISRGGHSYFHLGSNHILKRLVAFFIGWLFVLTLWIVILTQKPAIASGGFHINF